jgi:hypothetical protein
MYAARAQVYMKIIERRSGHLRERQFGTEWLWLFRAESVNENNLCGAHSLPNEHVTRR